MNVHRLFFLLFFSHFSLVAIGGQYIDKEPSKEEPSALAKHPQLYEPPAYSPYTLPKERTMYFGLEYLLWQFRLDGLPYAFNEFQQITNNPKHRHVRYVPNRWMSGLRATIGSYVQKDQWHSEATYTFYRNKTANAVDNPGLYPTWLIGDEFTGAYSRGRVPSAGGAIDLLFQSVDFLLLTEYFDSFFLQFTPSLGVKAFWLKQDYQVKYAHQFATNFQELLEMNNNQAIVGFGPEIGMKGRWSFDQMISLISSVSFTVAPAHFDTVRVDTEQLVPLDTSTQITVINTRNRYWGTASCVDMTLGPQFEWWFGDVHFSVNGLWEMQLWYAMNRALSLYQGGPIGDLLFTGATFQLHCGF